MLFVKYLSGAIIGGALGCVGLVLVLYPLFLAAEGGRDMNGGIAMGMVTSVAPVGLLVGLVAGIMVVAALDRRKSSEENSNSGRGPAFVLISIIALIVGYFGLLSYLQGPAKISFATEPMIHFEIRTTSKSLSSDANFRTHADLFNHRDNSAVPVSVSVLKDGDIAEIRGSFQMNKKTQERALRAHLGPDLLLSINLPLFPGFEMTPGMTKWRAVDFIKRPVSGDLEAAFAQKEHMVRYEAIPLSKDQN